MSLRNLLKSLQFLWYFHFWPSQPSDPVVIGMRQAQVDQTIARLVARFRGACREQEAYQAQYNPQHPYGYCHKGSDPINPDWDHFSYKRVKSDVIKRKRILQKARRLAKWAGFEVRPKLRDYLTRQFLLHWELKEAGVV